jgi:hypothetical protein
MTDNNWLNPETAIGARLPCGATVVRAEWYCSSRRLVECCFDRTLDDDSDWNVFYSDGSDWHSGQRYCLIPPSQPAEPAYAEEQLLQAAREAAARMHEVSNLSGLASHIRGGQHDDWGIVQSALIALKHGVAALLPKPKPEPWRAAYEAWASEQGHGSVAIEPWRAGWEAAKREGGE